MTQDRDNTPLLVLVITGILLAAFVTAGDFPPPQGGNANVGGPQGIGGVSIEVEAADVEGAAARRSAAQTISNASSTFIELDVVRYEDQASYFDLVSDDTRVTFPSAGKYLVIVYGLWVFDADGERFLRCIHRDSSDVFQDAREQRMPPGPSNAVGMQASFLIEDAGSGYCQFEVWHNAGNDLDVFAEVVVLKIEEPAP